MEELSENVRSFYSGHIKRLHNPKPMEFMRECVASHQPCILTGILNETEWKCLDNWKTSEEFLKRAPSTVDVNITPDGLGDSVNSMTKKFMIPLEMEMKTETFFSMLDKPDNDNDAIPYLSSQNDNLRLKMPILLNDCSNSLPLADECFDCLPEAINLWIGDERSISSLHKDYFENMYCVIRGTKTFTLMPPTDIAFVPTSEFPMKTYKYNPPSDGDGDGDGNVNRDVSSSGNGTQHDDWRPQKGDLIMTEIYHEQDDEPKNGDNKNKLCDPIPWIWLDPNDPDAIKKHSLFKYASPMFDIEVHAGEVLYLPSMWLHRVSQKNLTISVNFWYDMKFDFKYCFMKSASYLADTITKNDFNSNVSSSLANVDVKNNNNNSNSNSNSNENEYENEKQINIDDAANTNPNQSINANAYGYGYGYGYAYSNAPKRAKKREQGIKKKEEEWKHLQELATKDMLNEIVLLKIKQQEKEIEALILKDLL
jgi:peptidyl-lysine (3S)-dioxygenase / protease